MRRRTARTLAGIAVLVVTVSVLYAVAVVISAYRLRHAYDALRAAGRPMSVADLIPPEVPDSQNAALLYKSAALFLKAQPADRPWPSLLSFFDGLSRVLANGSIDPNHIVEAKGIFRRDVVTRALSIVEQAEELSSSRFLEADEYSSGDLSHVPQMHYIAGIGTFLGLKACVDADAGRTSDAWNAILSQLRLADVLSTEPWFLGQVAREQMIQSACVVIQRVCDTSLPDISQYGQIEQFLDRFQDPNPMILGFDAERLLMETTVFRMPEERFREDSEARRGYEWLPKAAEWWRSRVGLFKPVFLADHAAYLRWTAECIDLLKQDCDPDKTSLLRKTVTEAANRGRLSGIIMWSLYYSVTMHADMIAQLRVTRVGLALLQYKQAHGNFPESLDVLDLHHVEDPFSKRSLNYQRESGGFVLYSVGPDRKDNGGVPKQRKKIKEYDLVWRFPGSEPNIPDRTAK